MEMPKARRRIRPLYRGNCLTLCFVVLAACQQNKPPAVAEAPFEPDTGSMAILQDVPVVVNGGLVFKLTTSPSP